MSTISMRQQRQDANQQAARGIRADLDAAGVTCISLVGPAGSGKTSVIEAVLQRLDAKTRVAVIMGNLAAERQVERLARLGHRAVPVAADPLSAILVRQALEQLDKSKLDLLLIEADASSASASEFDLGQHLRAGVFSVAGGDDKATEFPSLVAGSDVVVLTKIDLLPFVTFDLHVFTQDVARLKPGLPTFQTSMQSGAGIDKWLAWVQSHLAARAKRCPGGAS